MRTRLALAALAVAATTVVGIAAPAHAAKPIVDQFGRGTWTTVTSGATFTGETTGAPFAGATVGSIAPDDGTNPPWPGCEPGSGTVTTTTADGRTITLTLFGDICTAVHPAGRLIFQGWYDVTQFDGKGRRVADGRGSAEVRTYADGTAEWYLDGQLY